jgi:hypothetical protein
MEKWIITKIELDIDKKELNEYLFKSFTIDSKGNTLDETEFDSDSNVVCKRIYRYFETGEMKEFVEFDPLDSLLERQSYSKDDSGVIYKTEIEYADKATVRNEDGEITGYEIYVYDDEGNVIQEKEQDEQFNDIFKYIKTYDENGLLNNEKRYESETLISAESFEYDKSGNVIKKIHRNYIEKFEVIDIYEFDEEGNMIYNSSHQNGTLIFENKCGYDNKNNLASEEFFELDFWEGRIVRHERLKHRVDK